MKIIIAPDKFKGSLTAIEACEAIREGIKDVIPGIQILEMPIADGGNGTAKILAENSKGRMVPCRVHDPLFRMIGSSFAISGDGKTAFVEMASASGLELLKKNEQNCYFTTTFGTGELILAALHENVKKIILCIGGSATNDGGTGMAAALGYRFLDSNRNPLEPIGKNLEFIYEIDDSEVDPRIKNIEIEVACDVDNPLIGPLGAAWIYGPQKGATSEQLTKLDEGLRKLAAVIQLKYNKAIDELPGAGAAGGLGGGASIFLNARLKSGIDIVLRYLHFEENLPSCQLVITGEGKLDKQSLMGKVIKGILNLTLKHNVPLAVMTGKLELTSVELSTFNLDHTYCITPPGVSDEKAMKNAAIYLRKASSIMAIDLLKS